MLISIRWCHIIRNLCNFFDSLSFLPLVHVCIDAILTFNDINLGRGLAKDTCSSQRYLLYVTIAVLTGIYMYTYNHILIKYMCVCLYVFMFIRVCVCTYICMHVCTYVCMYVRMCACMYE